jgi:glutamate dehydrogenase/leucine dehydrogenase
MAEKFNEVWKLSEERKISLRDAAMYLGVKTVCTALIARGRLS